jgi:hypothetical protein
LPAGGQPLDYFFEIPEITGYSSGQMIRPVDRRPESPDLRLAADARRPTSMRTERRVG